MYCPVCKSFKTREVFTYKKPDKYEKVMGINEIERSWNECHNCQIFFQERTYGMEHLEKIYEKHYRSKKFRGEPIKKAFDRIAKNPTENDYRLVWFTSHIQYDDFKNVLDIGSGLGVWPYFLKKAEYKVTCVEANEESINHIYENLNISCYKNLYPKQEFDVVSIIHVLEHMSEPESILQDARDVLRDGGKLFVEVPDSVEFGYLKKGHDEFNSCHALFYNVPTLYNVLEKNGFHVEHMHRAVYEDRKLSRILTVATKKP